MRCNLNKQEGIRSKSDGCSFQIPTMTKKDLEVNPEDFCFEHEEYYSPLKLIKLEPIDNEVRKM